MDAAVCPENEVDTCPVVAHQAYKRHICRTETRRSRDDNAIGSAFEVERVDRLLVWHCAASDLENSSVQEDTGGTIEATRAAVRDVEDSECSPGPYRDVAGVQDAAAATHLHCTIH